MSVAAPVATFGRRLRFFASPRQAPASRRATDALLLCPALIGLAVLVAAYSPGRVERALSRFLVSLSGWPDPIWQFLYDLLLVGAVGIVIAVVAGRRVVVILQLGAALVAATFVGAVATRVAVGSWPGAGELLGREGAPYPVIRVAQAGAVILAVSPYLVRGLQRAFRWILFVGLVGALLVHPATPGSTLAAFLIAVAAATGVRLVFGTSVGRPGLDDVGLALRALGVFATDLRPPRREVSGVFAVEAEEAATGAPLLLKIYGRDAYDTQLLATFWRRLWYQDGAVPFGVGRLQAVEREALVTLLAARAGVATREVAVAGATPAGDALLVLRGAAEPLAHLGADSVELRPYWESLEQLHAAGIAHREIDATTVGLVRGLPGFVDLGRAATTLAPDQLQADRAQLLAATAAVAGERRAVTEAVAAIGDDGVANLLPYLQMPAFGPELRRSLKAGAVDVDELRRSASLAAGAAEPELARLRRVTWGSAVQIALLVLAVGALVKIVGGVDYDELATDLADATWGWIAVAMVVAQLPRLTQAAASLGSIAAELRFGPVYVLQLASSYLNLALPSSLARMAVSIRFFQRQGQPPAAAVTAGAIGSVTGTAVQALLVSTIVLFSSHDLPLDLTTPSGGSLRLLSILAGLLVLTVLAVAAIGRVRRRLVHRVRVWWPQVATSLTALRAPNKLLLLVGGTIATEVLFAAALGLTTRAFGAHIPLSELIVVNSGVSLLSSLIPVPGGIGVVELGLEVGLTSAGMTPSAALAAIALYRVATFYLPPAWGFFAFRWLQQNRYL